MFEILLSFITLFFLEIILGIDNIIFIAIIVSSLKKNVQNKVRIIGITLSVVLRMVFLLLLLWILKITQPFITIWGISLSFKDIILIIGGGFLIIKATLSIHSEVDHESKKEVSKINTPLAAIVQVAIIDIIFSLDSLITAVGVTQHFYVIVAAIIISIIFMLYFSKLVTNLISKYKTLKILALAFIMLIGLFLVLNGFGIEINKNYLYFAVLFSLAVETINIYIKKKNTSA